MTFEVTLLTGFKEIPALSQLDIITSVTGPTAASTCTMNVQDDVAVGSVLSAAIPAGETITCQISVIVDTQHQNKAMIESFTVTANWSGAAGAEFYVPPVDTQPVPVYTGGELEELVSVVKEVELGGKYHKGMWWNMQEVGGFNSSEVVPVHWDAGKYVDESLCCISHASLCLYTACQEVCEGEK